jgi:hypothetical protein
MPGPASPLATATTDPEVGLPLPLSLVADR